MNENENQYPYYYYPQASPAYYPGYDYRQMQMMPQQQQQQPPQPQQDQTMLPDMEQSYIENILRLNIGKVATVYMTFENNAKWNAKIFKGEILAAGRDHIILKDLETDKRYLLLMLYLDYITFDGEINYTYPYGP
ncbi:spore coat protein GerQ [Virgibacillus necropolis]|uniref:spore coat protein GerQ n=1 Tax=Virgibacillus necropolis TaxID=163877 RepID=UPI00384D46AC